jgi:hypothetical protein
MGRVLAIFGWVAWQTRRLFDGTRLSGVSNVLAPALAVLLVLLAAVPIVLPFFEPQPQDVQVEQIFGGAAPPDGWVRLRGRVSPLRESPTGTAGSYALLVDEVNPLRAIVVEASEALQPVASTALTGRLQLRGVTLKEELPIEATIAGTPPRVVPDRIVVLDATTTPTRSVPWMLAILPLLLAAILFIGSRVGYPIFRPASDIDVLATPLSPGERIPSAYGGRIGPNRADLANPASVLLLVRRGERGNLLTAQPLTDSDGPAPAPVLIGGSWTSGAMGTVHTVRERVAALRVRSEQVDATFLFARMAERDRVAALVAVTR